VIPILLPLLTEVFRTVNLVLEGEPVELRKARALAMFWVTWPLTKVFLDAVRTPPSVIASIQQMAEKANASSNNS